MPIEGVMAADGQVGGAVNASAPNYLQVVADFSQAAWNTKAGHVVFFVSGRVRMRVWAFVEQEIIDQSGASMWSVSWSATGGTSGPDMGTGGVWDVTENIVAWTIITSNAMKDIITQERQYVQIAGESALSGRISFHCVWEPMTPGATVVVGDGSAPG